MKILSIRAPWAQLIVRGIQPLANLKFRQFYTGPVAIHAAGEYDPKQWAVAAEQCNNISPAAYRFLGYLYKSIDFDKRAEQRIFGGVIGFATAVRTTNEGDCTWFAGPYALHLEDAKESEFVPLRMPLGLHSVSGPHPNMEGLTTKLTLERLYREVCGL